jgi:Zn-dependent protease with chaperone function
MTVGAVLIGYAMVVGFFGAAGVRRTTWPLRAPRLGAAAILAAAWSVPLALALAGLTLALPTGALTVDLGHLIGACLMRLRAAYGTPTGVGIMTAGQLLSAATLGRIAWACGRVALRRRLAWRRHRLLVRLSGERRPGVEAVVLDHPGPVAYSVAGRRPAVVVSSGAIELLTRPELDAVLAHENAHLSGRHHRTQAAAALIAAALPIAPLARDAPALVGRLLEMDADERAAGHHEPRVLARALVAVTSAGAAAPSAGTGSATTRGFAGSDALARVRRLTSPPVGLPRRHATLTKLAVVAVTVAPLLLAVAPALFALY